MSEWIDLTDNAPTWDKKNPIQGIYTHKQTGVGKNKSNLYNIKTKDGNFGVWGSTVLDTKFDQIPEGSEVRIESLGVQESKNGNEYNDFKVQYKPAEVKVEDIFPGSQEVL